MSHPHQIKPVSPEVDFVAMERRWLERWAQNGLLDKYLKKNENATKRFSFIDGPITANNPMGVHHAWARTYKDLWQRYKNMRGFKQRFQNGFDCQGLWVEVGVERELGFNSKKDIERYGIGKFTQTCIDRVRHFAQKQTEQSIRLGYFMDWESSYYTMSETNNLYIWAFLKRCHQKNLIYKSQSAVVWCPRCETGLSKHEQADGYREVDDESVYVRFKLVGREEQLLVWTTTPWTLLANVLLAVNTSQRYVKAKEKGQGDLYVLAEKAAHRLGLTIVGQVDPSTLLNAEYERLYQIPAQEGIRHYVVDWEQVDPAEGTGVVHIAPGCGEEDFELGKKLGCSVLSPLREDGRFGEGYGSLSRKFASEVTSEVVGYLKSKGLLFKTEKYRHSYPHCWRCGTKCLFRLEDNWFIRLAGDRQGLKSLARQARWIPEFVGKRMQNWLDTMGDWMIGRKRYYGLALPFYECGSCGQLTVIGSKDELRGLALKPELIDRLPSFHRPWIDEIAIKCPCCGSAVTRTKDVGDCWLDAGVVPYSTLKYFEDKSYWQAWYPADWIVEMVEQVRLWYYSMLVYGYIFEGKMPYLRVSSISEVRDENGERISKSKGNGIPYDEAIERMGADVMRWLYCSVEPAQNLNFGYRIADETRRYFYLPLWNVYKYFVTYAALKSWHPGKSKVNSPLSVLDQWLLSRINRLVREVTDGLDDYDAHNAAKLINLFVQDFSTWYIRRSRNRAVSGDQRFFATAYQALVTLTKLLAPFVPFLAEEMFTNLTGDESVHLQDWPEVSQANIDQPLETKMELARAVVELGHAQRRRQQVKVRQPLAKLLVDNPPEKLAPELLDLIKDELNVKQIEVRAGEGEMAVEYDVQLSPQLKAEGEAREIIRRIQEVRKTAGCRLEEKVSVGLPSWPREYTEMIKEKTLAQSLFRAEELVVKRESS